VVPEHCVDPGEHTPAQAPPEQMYWHAAAEPHWPFDWQVCTPLPEHCVAPGVHTPPHAPLMHTYVQALAVPQAPFD
jgi:hypothetical protein